MGLQCCGGWAWLSHGVSGPVQLGHSAAISAEPKQAGASEVQLAQQAVALEVELRVAVQEPPGNNPDWQQQVCKPVRRCAQELDEQQRRSQQLQQPQFRSNNQTQYDNVVRVRQHEVQAREGGHNPVSQLRPSYTWSRSNIGRLATQFAERTWLPRAAKVPRISRQLLLPARWAAHCAAPVGFAMGCRQATNSTDFDSDSDFGSSSTSGDIVRTVSEASSPVRISSRHLHLDQLVHQRNEAAMCFGSDVKLSPQRRTRVALFGRASADGGVFRGESRMSNMPSEELAQMVGEIKKSSNDLSRDNRGKDRHGLEGRLDDFGMCMKEMKSDGNCQFRSLAFNLFGDQDYHAVMRKAAVAHMRKHANFFGNLFEDAAEFNAYLHDMARARTWGDELTLRAVIEAYNCEAHVITNEPANWYLVYQSETSTIDPTVAACPPKTSMPRPGKQVFLAYLSPVHYNSIVRRKHRD